MPKPKKPNLFDPLARAERIREDLTGKAGKGSASQPSRARERLTIHVVRDLADRLRRVVYFTPGATVTSMVEEALGEAIARAERKNRGPFPVIPAGKQIVRGRPPGPSRRA